MNRRGFLKSILAAGVAPAFVGSSVLMPVRSLWTPDPVFLQSVAGATSLTWQDAVAGQYVWIVNNGNAWALSGNKMESLTSLPGDVRPLQFNESAQLIYDGSAWREVWRTEHLRPVLERKA